MELAFDLGDDADHVHRVEPEALAEAIGVLQVAEVLAGVGFQQFDQRPANHCSIDHGVFLPWMAMRRHPGLRTPEDVAFYRALLRVGARFRHSPLVQVTTSARQTVRTAGGFAEQLNQWESIGSQQAFLVESAAAIETRLQTRQQLRALWQSILQGYQPITKDVAVYANSLGINEQWLWEELKRPQTFDLLFETIKEKQHFGVWQKKWPLVDLKLALFDLNSRLKFLRSQPLLDEFNEFRDRDPLYSEHSDVHHTTQSWR